jgi:hypothetical protein
VAALAVGGELNFVDGEEVDLAVERHRLDGADEIAGGRREDLFLAGDQRHRRRSLDPRDAIVDLAREQAQRQTDHARAVRHHAFDREMRLAGIGRAEHGRDPSGTGGPAEGGGRGKGTHSGLMPRRRAPSAQSPSGASPSKMEVLTIGPLTFGILGERTMSESLTASFSGFVHG